MSSTDEKEPGGMNSAVVPTASHTAIASNEPKQRPCCVNLCEAVSIYELSSRPHPPLYRLGARVTTKCTAAMLLHVLACDKNEMVLKARF